MRAGASSSVSLDRPCRCTMLLLTFKAGANRYAIDVVRVIELVPRVELRPIPHAPPFLAGLLSYRGKVIPVIDLGLLLDGAPCRDLPQYPHDPGQRRRRAIKIREPTTGGGGSFLAMHRAKRPVLLGLLAENVERPDLYTARTGNACPVQLPDAPYLDAIVQTDHGIVSADRGAENKGLLAFKRLR